MAPKIFPTKKSRPPGRDQPTAFKERMDTGRKRGVSQPFSQTLKKSEAQRPHYKDTEPVGLKVLVYQQYRKPRFGFA
jgi:hypothetical protein